MSKRQTAGVGRPGTLRRIVAELERGLEAYASRLEAAGRNVSDVGSAREIVDRMLATLPEPTEWNDLVGPFYRTSQVARILGVTRQAVEDRRGRGTLLACLAADGGWAFPSFQLDRGRVRREVRGLLALFDTDAADGWTLAAWLRNPQPSLDGLDPLTWTARHGSTIACARWRETSAPAGRRECAATRPASSARGTGGFSGLPVRRGSCAFPRVKSRARTLVVLDADRQPRSGALRLSLEAPHGTCYLADDPVAALLELSGPGADGGVLSSGFLEQRLVWSLRLSRPLDVADATDRRAARFGVTKELGTITSYGLAHMWADALHAAGHAGLVWWLRIDPSAGRGVGLFGKAGERSWRRGESRGALEYRDRLERETGLRVVDVPYGDSARLVGVKTPFWGRLSAHARPIDPRTRGAGE